MTSAGTEAVALAARAGLELDPWQQAVLMDSLGERRDGKWAAFEVGLVVPRQNGKGSILEARELAGLFLFGERLIIHSAHEQATSSEHFRRLLGLIESVPEFKARVKKAPQGKGSESIELHSGERILFKTRTGGGGRGLTGDLVVLDEAMILPEATTSALVPLLSAKSVHGNPQLWYVGSAVDRDIHEHGTVLARVRDRAMRQAEDLAYFEWSAPAQDPQTLKQSDRESPAVWAQANPGLGIRISEEHVAKECDGALGPRGFAVERLGVGDWPPLDMLKGQGLDLLTWQGLFDEESRIAGALWFAFDVRPDRSGSSIGVAGRRADGLLHVETIDCRPGTGWIAERLVELSASHSPSGILCDQASPAASLVDDIANRGLKVKTTTTAELAQACGQFFDAVEQGSVRHRGEPEMEAAVRGAVKRNLGEAFAWSRKSSAVDITPLMVATLAAFGAQSQGVSAYESSDLLVV